MGAIKQLAENLKQAQSIEERIALLDAFPQVRCFLEQTPALRSFLERLSREQECIVKQLIAIGQWERIAPKEAFDGDRLEELFASLAAVDAFYKEMGGIVGYQVTILDFLQRGQQKTAPSSLSYHSPVYVDIAEETKEVFDAILQGIRALPRLAKIFPLGGAADRLHLVDERTGLELPAAKLVFAGRTLLEGLIRDLAAQEYLYYKLYRKQLTTPIAIMTSQEKNNHAHVLQICREAKWFGRPKESFRCFLQPLVPTVDEEGNWCLLAPFRPFFKPGGHGAVWKVAKDEGIFRWCEELGRTYALVRQINNPLAALDYGLLAFLGVGAAGRKVFGFASCPRLLQAAEGVNVLIEKEGGQIVLTNIEYCDFPKFGIEDLPLKEKEPYSRFSSNTNILFGDLAAIQRAVERCPYPGLLVNGRRSSYTTEAGEKREGIIARLESTMQNIADVFVESKGEDFKTKHTFVTYNHRHKTISTAKRVYQAGKPLQETPEQCFYDLLTATREVLERHCDFHLPKRRSLEEYLALGPECVFLYHPALGPLYSILRQKIRGGVLFEGAELELEIADLEIENLSLQGSLLIRAEQVMGAWDERGVLRYCERTGQCSLKNVTFRNEGVEWGCSAPFWKHQPRRKEAVEIHLKGHSAFFAEDIALRGSERFVVEDGQEMRLEKRGDGFVVYKRKIEPSIFWKYRFDGRAAIERGTAKEFAVPSRP